MRFTGFLAFIYEMMIFSEKGLRTVHKAKVYTSLKRPEQGVRLMYGCVPYTQN